jgi:hypothetical protein
VDVSIVVPTRASEARYLAGCLAGIVAQRYADGRTEVLIAQYGDGNALPFPVPAGRAVRHVTVDHASPYVARNRAVSRAAGEIFLFTEPGCVPAPDWVAAHVTRLRDPAVTVSVGAVAPARSTRLLDLFLSYEDVRDAWVFSRGTWRHRFGRPQNMAIARRRFETHGPFAEVARGADSTFVQRVARELSCREVALTPEAIVRPQSIRGLPSCFRDRLAHGRTMRRHRSSHAAPIPFVDRVRLFREAVRQHRHGPMGAAALLALLGAGVLVFRAGGWVGALQGPPGVRVPHTSRPS